MKRLISLAIFGFIFISCAYEASAQSIDAKSLRGIKNVRIVAEDLDPEARRFVSQEDITRILKGKLERRGIPVVTNIVLADRYNFLYANLNLLTDDRGVMFNVELSFNQMATLENDDSMVVITWTKGILAKGGINGARSQIIKILEQLTDQFLLDYLTVNR